MAKFNKSKHKNYIDRKGRLHKKPSSINISPKFFNRDFTLLNNIPAPGEGFPPGINNWIQYYEWLQTSSEGNYYLEQIDILLDQGYSCDQIGFSRYIPGDVNGDGTLNVLDIVGLVGVILGGDAFDLSSHPCFGKFVDLNGDGSSNVLDIVNLINSILSPSGGYADDYCDDEDALNYGSPGGCYYSCIGSSNNPEFLGDQSVNTPCCITEDIFVNESRRGDCSDGSDPDPCGWCLGDPLYNLVYSTCTILGEFDQNWLATCPEDQPCCAYNAFFAIPDLYDGSVPWCDDYDQGFDGVCVEPVDGSCPEQSCEDQGLVTCSDGSCAPDEGSCPSDEYGDYPDHNSYIGEYGVFDCGGQCYWPLHGFFGHDCISGCGNSFVDNSTCDEGDPGVDLNCSYWGDDGGDCGGSSAISRDVIGQLTTPDCVLTRTCFRNDSSELRNLEVDHNFVGCPSIWGHVDPNTNMPYVNHDWNCFEPYDPLSYWNGNPTYCMGCYNPGTVLGSFNGSPFEVPVPQYTYVCKNDISGVSWVGDYSSCNGGCGDLGGCIIKPNYVCLNDPEGSSYGLDNTCNNECSGNICVDKTIHCCLSNFPHEWFTRFRNKYPTPDDIPNIVEDYSVNFRFFNDNSQSFVGNSGPRKVVSSNYWMPEPNDNIGWNTMVCSDLAYSGDNCNSTTAAPGDSCGSGICVDVGGPYENPIIAIFGHNSTYCGPGSNLLSCSECNVENESVNNCDIRGILPRFEHVPVTPDNSDDILAPFWTMFNDFTGGEFVGRVCNCDGCNMEGYYCETNAECDIEGNNPVDCDMNGTCVSTCDINVVGPPTLFQQLMYDKYVTQYDPFESYGGWMWGWIDELLYFDNNIFTYPIIVDNCVVPHCQTHRYYFAVGQEGILDEYNPEKFVMKIYDPVTHNVYTAGCFGFQGMDLDGQITYSIHPSRTCDGADLEQDIPVSGQCSHDENRRCYKNEHCKLDTLLESSSGTHQITPDSCFIGGCTDDAACNWNSNAIMDDGSCEYRQTYCQDNDGDGKGACPADHPEYCNDVCDDPGDGWALVDEDNPCDEDDDCPAPEIYDSCGLCINDILDGWNTCDGEMDFDGGTCTCPEDWDWTGGPCWSVVGSPGFQFDCTGECFGTWVEDPCNIGYGEWTEEWYCVREEDDNKVTCYLDADHDGIGCNPDEILNTNCQPIFMCPGQNEITDPGAEPPFIGICPCRFDPNEPHGMNDECWSNSNTDNDDWCVEWHDGCGHCTYVGDQTYLECTADDGGGGGCITDYDGYKVDDCEICLPMNCCDVFNDTSCFGSYDADTGSWLLSNGRWTNPENNPCSNIFGCTQSSCWIPGNLAWNSSCSDCAGYCEGHPNVTGEWGAYEPYVLDWTGLTSTQHCCKVSGIDPCGVCAGINDPDEDYWMFPDYDDDSLPWGDIFPWCGYSATTGGPPASPFGLTSGVCTEYVEGECLTFEILGCAEMAEYWEIEEDVACCCHPLYSECILYEWYSTCKTVVGNTPIHRARFDSDQQTITTVPYLPYGECIDVKDPGDCPEELTGTLKCCLDDTLPYCPHPMELDCAELCSCFGPWGGNNEIHNLLCEAKFDACGDCNGPHEEIPIYYIDVLGNGNGYGNGVEFCGDLPNLQTDGCPNVMWSSYNFGGETFSGCTNTVADNYVFSEFPCLCTESSELCESAGNLGDPDDDYYVGILSDSTRCHYLKILYPNNGDDILVGYSFNVSLNSKYNGQSNSNICGVDESIESTQNILDSECYHNLGHPDAGNGYNVDLAVIGQFDTKNAAVLFKDITTSESFLEMHYTIDVNHLTNTPGSSLLIETNYYGVDVLVAGHQYELSVYFPADDICAQSSHPHYLLDISACAAVDIIQLTARDPIIGCIDNGLLPSCNTECVSSVSDFCDNYPSETNICVGGPCERRSCATVQDCESPVTGGNCSGTQWDGGWEAGTDCQLFRPSRLPDGCPLGYGSNDFSACNWDPETPADIPSNNSCEYLEQYCPDFDLDGIPCVQIDQCVNSCVDDIDTDIYINMGDYGCYAGSGNCGELGSACNCAVISSIYTYTLGSFTVIGHHSFEMGVCRSLDGVGDVCEGGQKDYYLNGQDSSFSACGWYMDEDNGGHLDCPNTINSSTGLPFALGDTIPGLQDLCVGQNCVDPMCGFPHQYGGQGYHPPSNDYNSGNYQSLNITISDQCDPTCPDETNCGSAYPCSDSGNPCIYYGGDQDDNNHPYLVPTNPFYSLSCTGCTNVSSHNYDSSYTRPCHGGYGANDGWSLFDYINFDTGAPSWSYCMGLCLLNPFVRCAPDEAGNQQCKSSHSPSWDQDQCMFSPFQYSPESTDGYENYLYEWSISGDEETVGLGNFVNDWFNSQGLNCCCDFNYGCTDPNSVNYSQDAIKDCAGNLLENCSFGFDSFGEPTSASLHANVMINDLSDGETSCSDCLVRIDPLFTHNLKAGDYVRVGEGDNYEIMEIISLSFSYGQSTNPWANQFGFTVARGLFDTEIISHINEDYVYAQHEKKTCNHDCCVPYLVNSCLDIQALNYYCNGPYGLMTQDLTMCPTETTVDIPGEWSGLSLIPPSLDDTFGDGYDHIISRDCAGDSVSFAEIVVGVFGDTSCCQYQYDCAGGKCNPLQGLAGCGYDTSNAYYDYCGKCVGIGTEEAFGDCDGADCSPGYKQEGCGCCPNCPRGYLMDGEIQYADYDFDGFGAEEQLLSVVQNDVTDSLWASWIDVFESSYYAKYEIEKYPFCQSTVIYDEAGMFAGGLPCWSKPGGITNSSSESDGLIQCPCPTDDPGCDDEVRKRDCVGYLWTDLYCSNCNDSYRYDATSPPDCIYPGYVSSRVGEGHCISNGNPIGCYEDQDGLFRYEPWWFRCLDKDPGWNQLVLIDGYIDGIKCKNSDDLNTFINTQSELSFVLGLNDCTGDSDCTIYCPTEAGQFGDETDIAWSGKCNNGMCRHPGWLASAGGLEWPMVCDGTQFDTEAACYTNYYDCNGNCLPTSEGAKLSTCTDNCGGLSIGCTGSIGTLNYGNLIAPPYYIFNGSACTHDDSLCDRPVTCDEYLQSFCGIEGDQIHCSDFDSAVDTAIDYLYDINSTLVSKVPPTNISSGDRYCPVGICLLPLEYDNGVCESYQSLQDGQCSILSCHTDDYCHFATDTDESFCANNEFLSTYDPMGALSMIGIHVCDNHKVPSLATVEPPYICNFGVVECDDDSSNCNQYGYKSIVNGFDCFCDCHSASCDHDGTIRCKFDVDGDTYCNDLSAGSTCILDVPIGTVAQLDSCSVCSGGNVRSTPNDMSACEAGGIIHDPDGFNSSQWPNLDCNCECKSGTPKYTSIHNSCDCSECSEEYCENYGEALIHKPFAYGYICQNINPLTGRHEPCENPELPCDPYCTVWDDNNDCITEVDAGECATTILPNMGCGGDNPINSSTCGCTGGNVPYNYSNSPTGGSERSDKNFCFVCLNGTNYINGYDSEKHAYCIEHGCSETNDCGPSNNQECCISCTDCTGIDGCEERCPNRCDNYGCSDPWAINYHPMAKPGGGGGDTCIYKWLWNNLSAVCVSGDCDEDPWNMAGNNDCTAWDDGCDGCTGIYGDSSETNHCGGRFRAKDWFCNMGFVNATDMTWIGNYEQHWCGLAYGESTKVVENNSYISSKIGLLSYSHLHPHAIPRCSWSDGVPSPTSCIGGDWGSSCSSFETAYGESSLWTSLVLSDIPFESRSPGEKSGKFGDIRLWAHDFTFRMNLSGDIISNALDDDNTVSFVIFGDYSGDADPLDPTGIPTDQWNPDYLVGSDFNTCNTEISNNHPFIIVKWSLNDITDCVDGDCTSAYDAYKGPAGMSRLYADISRNWFRVRISPTDKKPGDSLGNCEDDPSRCIDIENTYIQPSRWTHDQNDPHGLHAQIPLIRATDAHACGDVETLLESSPTVFSAFFRKKHWKPQVDCVDTPYQIDSVGDWSYVPGETSGGPWGHGHCVIPTADGAASVTKWYGVCTSDDGCDCSAGSFGHDTTATITVSDGGGNTEITSYAIYGEPDDDNYAAFDNIWFDNFKMISSKPTQGGNISILHFEPRNQVHGKQIDPYCTWSIFDPGMGVGLEGGTAPSCWNLYSLHNNFFELSMLDDIINCDLTYGMMDSQKVGQYSIAAEANEPSDGNDYFANEYGGPYQFNQCWDPEYQDVGAGCFAANECIGQSHGVEGGAGMRVNPGDGGEVDFSNIGLDYVDAMGNEITYYDHLNNLHTKNRLIRIDDVYFGVGINDLQKTLHGRSQVYDWSPGNLVDAYNGGVKLPGDGGFIGSGYNSEKHPTDDVFVSYYPIPTYLEKDGGCPNIYDVACNSSDSTWKIDGFPNASLGTSLSPRDRSEDWPIYASNAAYNGWNGKSSCWGPPGPAATICPNLETAQLCNEGFITFGCKWKEDGDYRVGSIFEWQDSEQWLSSNFDWQISNDYFHANGFYYFVAKAGGDQLWYNTKDGWGYPNFVEGLYEDVTAQWNRPDSIWVYALPKNGYSSVCTGYLNTDRCWGVDDVWETGKPTYFVWYYTNDGDENEASVAEQACEMISGISEYACVAFRAPSVYLKEDVNYYTNREYYMEPPGFSGMNGCYNSVIHENVISSGCTNVDNSTADTLATCNYDPGTEWSGNCKNDSTWQPRNYYPLHDEGEINISFAILITPPQVHSKYDLSSYGGDIDIENTRGPECDCAGVAECGGTDMVDPSDFIVGCTDPTADNYCDYSIYDNGSCKYTNTLYLDTCPQGDDLITGEVINGDAYKCDGYCLGIPDSETGEMNNNYCVKVTEYGHVANHEQLIATGIFEDPRAESEGWIKTVNTIGFYDSTTDIAMHCHITVSMWENGVDSNSDEDWEWRDWKGDMKYHCQFIYDWMQDTSTGVGTFSFDWGDTIGIVQTNYIDDLGGNLDPIFTSYMPYYTCPGHHYYSPIPTEDPHKNDGKCLTFSGNGQYNSFSLDHSVFHCDSPEDWVEGCLLAPDVCGEDAGDFCDEIYDDPGDDLSAPLCTWSSHQCRRDCEKVCYEYTNSGGWVGTIQDLVGDTFCDSDPFMGGFNLNCFEWGYEGGDCDPADTCGDSFECGCDPSGCSGCGIDQYLGVCEVDVFVTECSCSPWCLRCDIASFHMPSGEKPDCAPNCNWNNDYQACSDIHYYMGTQGYSQGVCCHDTLNRCGGVHNSCQNHCGEQWDWPSCECSSGVDGDDVPTFGPGTLWEDAWKTLCIIIEGINPMTGAPSEASGNVACHQYIQGRLGIDSFWPARVHGPLSDLYLNTAMGFLCDPGSACNDECPFWAVGATSGLDVAGCDAVSECGMEWIAPEWGCPDRSGICTNRASEWPCMYYDYWQCQEHFECEWQYIYSYDDPFLPESASPNDQMGEGMTCPCWYYNDDGEGNTGQTTDCCCQPEGWSYGGCSEFYGFTCSFDANTYDYFGYGQVVAEQICSLGSSSGSEPDPTCFGTYIGTGGTQNMQLMLDTYETVFSDAAKPQISPLTEDCNQNCVPTSWIGDGVCDDADYPGRAYPQPWTMVQWDTVYHGVCDDPTSCENQCPKADLYECNMQGDIRSESEDCEDWDPYIDALPGRACCKDWVNSDQRTPFNPLDGAPYDMPTACVGFSDPIDEYSIDAPVWDCGCVEYYNGEGNLDWAYQDACIPTSHCSWTAGILSTSDYFPDMSLLDVQTICYESHQNLVMGGTLTCWDYNGNESSCVLPDLSSCGDMWYSDTDAEAGGMMQDGMDCSDIDEDQFQTCLYNGESIFSMQAEVCAGTWVACGEGQRSNDFFDCDGYCYVVEDYPEDWWLEPSGCYDGEDEELPNLMCPARFFSLATCGPEDTREAMRSCWIDEECALSLNENMDIYDYDDIDNWLYVNAVFNGPPSWYTAGESCDCNVWPWSASGFFCNSSNGLLDCQGTCWNDTWVNNTWNGSAAAGTCPCCQCAYDDTCNIENACPEGYINCPSDPPVGFSYMDLNCEQYSFGSPTNDVCGPPPEIGGECDQGDVCTNFGNGECVWDCICGGQPRCCPLSWLGDGECDDGFDSDRGYCCFMCEEQGWDDEDCLEDSTCWDISDWWNSEDGAGGDCSNCVPCSIDYGEDIDASYDCSEIGDGVCQDDWWCERWNWDNGDCGSDAPSCADQGLLTDCRYELGEEPLCLSQAEGEALLNDGNFNNGNTSTEPNLMCKRWGYDGANCADYPGDGSALSVEWTGQLGYDGYYCDGTCVYGGDGYCDTVDDIGVLSHCIVAFDNTLTQCNLYLAGECNLSENFLDCASQCLPNAWTIYIGDDLCDAGGAMVFSTCDMSPDGSTVIGYDMCDCGCDHMLAMGASGDNVLDYCDNWNTDGSGGGVRELTQACLQEICDYVEYERDCNGWCIDPNQYILADHLGTGGECDNYSDPPLVFDLNCVEHNWDGGDCEGEVPTTSCNGECGGGGYQGGCECGITCANNPMDPSCCSDYCEFCPDNSPGCEQDCEGQGLVTCSDGSCAATADDCPSCEFFDCTGAEACGYEGYPVDGWCDDADLPYGFDFNCYEHNWDNGDCGCLDTSDDDYDGCCAAHPGVCESEYECVCEGIPIYEFDSYGNVICCCDCTGLIRCEQAFPDGGPDWIGDGYCDDPTLTGNGTINLNCDWFQWDGGDCLFEECFPDIVCPDETCALTLQDCPGGGGQGDCPDGYYDCNEAVGGAENGGCILESELCNGICECYPVCSDEMMCGWDQECDYAGQECNADYTCDCFFNCVPDYEIENAQDCDDCETNGPGGDFDLCCQYYNFDNGSGCSNDPEFDEEDCGDFAIGEPCYFEWGGESSCDYGQYDCNLLCTSWLDPAFGADDDCHENFNCEEFDFDSCACWCNFDPACCAANMCEEYSDAQNCDVGSTACNVQSYTGSYGGFIGFGCNAFTYAPDGLEIEVDAGCTMDPSGPLCMFDCSCNCIHPTRVADAMNNGECDDGTWDTVNLMCQHFGWDYGDCNWLTSGERDLIHYKVCDTDDIIDAVVYSNSVEPSSENLTSNCVDDNEFTKGTDPSDTTAIEFLGLSDSYSADFDNAGYGDTNSAVLVNWEAKTACVDLGLNSGSSTVNEVCDDPFHNCYSTFSFSYKLIDICKIQPKYCDLRNEIGNKFKYYYELIVEMMETYQGLIADNGIAQVPLEDCVNYFNNAYPFVFDNSGGSEALCDKLDNVAGNGSTGFIEYMENLPLGNWYESLSLAGYSGNPITWGDVMYYHVTWGISDREDGVNGTYIDI